MNHPDTSSIEWFATYMRLNNRGLVPSVTPTEFMPTRLQLAHFMGPKYNSGYFFDSHGSPAYEEYARELFVRVHQIHWPVNSVVSFHFARGLLAEATGADVNWAEFGFKVTHPHQSRSSIPRVLPDFAELSQPLPPLLKVIPDMPEDEPIVVTPVDGPALRPRVPPGISVHPAPTVPNLTSNEHPAAMQPPRSAAAMAPHFKHATGSHVTVNLEVGGSSTQTALHPRKVDAVNWDLELVKIFPSLRALRGGIISLVEAEQRKSAERRHLAYDAVSKGKARYRQEKERTITFGRKLAESRIAYDGAVQEYERSRGVLAASMYGGNDNAASQDKRTVSRVTENCEALVNSCYARVQAARNRLGEWEFKSERHTAMKERLIALLKDAEDEYRQICKALDEELADLRALTDFLEQMDT